MEPSTIFALGAVIFAISSIYFYVRPQKRDTYNSPLLVSLITLVSQCVMAAGLLVSTGSDGEQLHWTRWAAYIASCTLLMWVIADRVMLSLKYKIELMYLTAITMVTGAFASVTEGAAMVLFFIIGGFTYVLMMRLIWMGNMNKLYPIKKYIYFGWSVFPLVFILSPEGFGIIPLALALVIYLVLDIFSKIVFYLEIK